MENDKKPARKKAALMDFLLPLLFLASWYILQAWVLPRFGVKT